MAESAKPKRSRVLSVTSRATTGRVVPLGYGKLRGLYKIRPGIDLTKPIFEQAVRGSRALRKAG